MLEAIERLALATSSLNNAYNVRYALCELVDAIKDEVRAEITERAFVTEDGEIGFR